MEKLNICIAGKNQIAVEALLYLISRNFSPYLSVLCNASDNGNSNWQPSLRKFAKELNIQETSLDKIYKEQNLIFISLEYDQIINVEKFRSRKLYNIHFSALPKYKGMYTSSLPILHAEKTSGVTLHVIDKGIDTGNIIDQCIFTITPNMTARKLYYKYMETGLSIFKKNIDNLICEKPIASKTQPCLNSTYYSRYALDYKNIKINLQATSFQISQQLKAFTFREYQLPKIKDYIIGDHSITTTKSVKSPGSILEQTKTSLTIATIDYDMILFKDCYMDWHLWLDNTISFEEISINADINSRDCNGWTPLIKCVYKGNFNKTNLLLQNHADPNIPNMNGTTPLMYAASSTSLNKYKIAKLLIGFSADPLKLDKFNKSLSFYHPNFLKHL